jgi:uncharacterized membrane protein YdbT with pleckstrin-like domain
MSWRNLVLRFMRVPPHPAPPPGSIPKVFRAAPNYFTMRMLGWLIAQAVAVGGIVFALLALRWVDESMPSYVRMLVRAAEGFAFLALLFQIVVGWMVMRLDYELRWYMLSDRAIRIREGITTVREKTIALANIQNISIRQGPVQGLFGIADVEVRTAGGGSGGAGGGRGQHNKGLEPMHIAYFRGVDNAEEIRDLLREAVRRHRDTGLGDPDDARHHPVQPAATHPGDALAAANEMLVEARRLRLSVPG